MRNLLFLSLILCSLSLFAQNKKSDTAYIRSLSVPHRAVNDFGKFLTVSEKQTLEKELTSYLKRTTSSIAILTLDSLTNPKTKTQYTIEETALQYFNKWGIGDSKKNNGVLLLVSRKPRGVRIEVGRGLESILTNNVCQSIVDDHLVPNFKQGLFFAGLKEAVAAIEQKLDNPPPVQQANASPAEPISSAQDVTYDVSGFRESGSSGMGGFFVVGFLMFIGIIIIGIFRTVTGRQSGMYSRSGYSNNSLFFSNNNSGWSSNDDSYSSFESSSSSWSSGDSSSSSSSSDSYSGGSSDGGGASGSW